LAATSSAFVSSCPSADNRIPINTNSKLRVSNAEREGGRERRRGRKRRRREVGRERDSTVFILWSYLFWYAKDNYSTGLIANPSQSRSPATS